MKEKEFCLSKLKPNELWKSRFQLDALMKKRIEIEGRGVVVDDPRLNAAMKSLNQRCWAEIEKTSASLRRGKLKNKRIDSE